MSRAYEIGVQMPCKGCAAAVTSALVALPNIKSAEASLLQQTVSVIADDITTLEQVMDVIQRTGKKVNGGRATDGEAIEQRAAAEEPNIAD